MAEVEKRMFPEAFLTQMRALLGAEFDSFLAALDAPPALALRVNALRPGAADAAAAYCGDPVPWARDGYYLRPGGRPGASLAHACGAFYLQEASAMLSAAVLDAQPGERILDLCAAPGGKSGQIAAALRGRGVLVSNEPVPSRARVLAENLERLGAANAVAVCAYPEHLAARWREWFDAVLVDAPCSGEGMFRREPAARAEWQPSAPAGCARRQAEILDRAAEMLRPGGRLVYSTCTFNRLENEGSVESFLDRHPEFHPEPFAVPVAGDAPGGMLRAWPHRLSGDGHFVARLRKADRSGEPDSPRGGKSARRGKKPSSAAATRRSADRRAGQTVSDAPAEALLAMLEAEICRIPDVLRGGTLVRQGDYIHLLPAGVPPLDGVRVVKPGLSLMRVGRSHIQPLHALAMAARPDPGPADPAGLDFTGAASQSFELDADRAARFLAGERPELPSLRGWVLLTHQSLPLGFVKARSSR